MTDEAFQARQRSGHQTADRLSQHLAKIKELVKRQAEDEGLWFVPEHVTEDYLQQSLRKLHAVIEEDQEVLAAFGLHKTLLDLKAIGFKGLEKLGPLPDA